MTHLARGGTVTTLRTYTGCNKTRDSSICIGPGRGDTAAPNAERGFAGDSGRAGR